MCRHIRRTTQLTIGLLTLALLTFGCSSRVPPVPDRIILDEHASGDDQAGMYGELLPQPLYVVVEGPVEPGMFGGAGGRRPVRDAEVVFEIEGTETGAQFEEGGPRFVTRTDAGGAAMARLRLGNKPGDVIVSATTESASGPLTVRLRATAGIEKLQSVFEGPTGSTLEEVGVLLRDPDGRPAEGITVYFHVEGNAKGSSVKRDRVISDSEGRAATSWRLGSATQQYFVMAEIEDKRPDVPTEERFRGRGIVFTAMALDKMNMVITLFGGLAVFIFGMTLMSGGLQRMADRRLKAILNAMTRNRILAVGVGALLTAVIQSSSATTVMVVGFVNAGLLTLTQAVGVVFGANIGTTMTAQILAFNLDAVSYPAIALGLILASLGRKQAVRALGESILGFGLLFLGMTTMSAVLKPLRYSPEFLAWFHMFQCTPVDGLIPWKQALICIVIGTVTTMVVQSSSATVGLVLALAAQGLIDFYTAVPLVLGDNIGTTITAQLAALGANRNSKRAAMAHTMFNVVGALYMYLLLFMPWWKGQPLFLGFVDSITPGDVFSSHPENLPRHIANAHTAFNLVNCVFFVPILGFMVRLCEWIIPVRADDQERVLEYLEEHLLATPTLALEQAIKEVAYMTRRAQKSVQEACSHFHKADPALEDSVRRREDVIDRLQKEINNYLTQISQRELMSEEAAIIPMLIHAVNDTERVGDICEDIVKIGNQMREQNLVFSEAAERDLKDLESLIFEQFEATRQALATREVSEQKRIRRRQIHEVATRIAESHVARLDSGACDVHAGVVFLDYVGYLENIGEHLVAISKRANRVVRVTES